jgi:hypothetical protein
MIYLLIKIYNLIMIWFLYDNLYEKSCEIFLAYYCARFTHANLCEIFWYFIMHVKSHEESWDV